MSDTNFPTEPLPATATQPLRVIEVPTGPQKRKRHPIRALVIVVLILVVLVVGFFVADHFARSYATSYVREKIATAVGLKSTAPVHVDLGGGSIILQAIAGHLDSAHVTVDPLTLEGATGAASVSATDVPLDQSKPIGTMTIDVTVPASTVQQQLNKAVPQLKQLGAKVSIAGQHVKVAFSVKVLGFISIPVSATITPGVTRGAPTFSLDTLTVSGTTTSSSAIDRLAPGLLDSLKSGQAICIANLLPREFTLTGVHLGTSSLVYEFSGDGAKLTSAALKTKGTCPKS